MDLDGLVVQWAGLGYAVAHPDHPLSTPLIRVEYPEQLVLVTLRYLPVP
jgi:hypothetical protein